MKRDDASGTGVLIAAGGLRYLTNAWVCVHMLRRKGCRLPIQIWHLGPAEIPPPFPDLFAPLGVELCDAHAYPRPRAPTLTGWSLKTFALDRTAFRHVLLMDADNVPVRDPTFLFDTPEYRRHGAIFWPDDPPAPPHRATLTAQHPIWTLCGLPYRGERSCESGQLCIDKGRCGRPLRLARWMNDHGDFWWRWLYGDKDTFQIAWRWLDVPYVVVPEGPRVLPGPVFVQLDFQGRPLFQHRHGDKWRLDGRNPAIPGFQDEDECRRALAELRRRLFEHLQAGRGPAPERLRGGRFVLSGARRAPQVIRFGDDGDVDAGPAGAVVCWTGSGRDGREVALVASDLRSQDRFRFDPRLGAFLGLDQPGQLLKRLER
jgi:hypothetical protein